MFEEKKTEGPVNVRFTVSSFRYKGVEYKSAEVEKAADEGNEEALAIVANLVKIGSGVVEIIEEETSSKIIEEGKEKTISEIIEEGKEETSSKELKHKSKKGKED
jgi:hypothetical protein